jgi:hypothetical protein
MVSGGRGASARRRDPDDQGIALATAATQGRSSHASAATLQLDGQAGAPGGLPTCPEGWPSAIAPPLTLTMSSETSQFVERMDTMPTAANASLSSNQVHVGD